MAGHHHHRRARPRHGRGELFGDLRAPGLPGTCEYPRLPRAPSRAHTRTASGTSTSAYWDYGGEHDLPGRSGAERQPGRRPSREQHLVRSEIPTGIASTWRTFRAPAGLTTTTPLKGGSGSRMGTLSRSNSRCDARREGGDRPPRPPGSRGRRALARTRSARQRNPQARGAATDVPRGCRRSTYRPPASATSLSGTTQDLPAIIPWWPSATAARSGSTMRAGRWSGRSRATPATSSGLSAFARSTTWVPAWGDSP